MPHLNEWSRSDEYHDQFHTFEGHQSMIHHDLDPASVRPGHQAPISVLVVLHGRVQYWTQPGAYRNVLIQSSRLFTNDDDA